MNKCSNIIKDVRIYVIVLLLLIIVSLSIMMVVTIYEQPIINQGSDYKNGKLVSNIIYNGDESIEYCIQYKLSRIDGLFNLSKIVEGQELHVHLKKGTNIIKSVMPNLKHGNYRVNLYILKHVGNDQWYRSSAFINDIKILK